MFEFLGKGPIAFPVKSCKTLMFRAGCFPLPHTLVGGSSSGCLHGSPLSSLNLLVSAQGLCFFCPFCPESIRLVFGKAAAFLS